MEGRRAVLTLAETLSPFGDEYPLAAPSTVTITVQLEEATDEVLAAIEEAAARNGVTLERRPQP